MNSNFEQPPARRKPEAVWISSAEAAAFLGVAVQTLAAWRHNGRGPAFSRPSPRVVRYDLSALERYMRAATVSSTTEADARDRRRQKATAA